MSEGRPELPGWEPKVAAMLVDAERAVAVVGRATPANLTEELRALEEAYRRDDRRAPRFRYEPLAPSRASDDLERLAESLDRSGEPLERAYAARARELALERKLCEAPGRKDFAPLARVRFAAAGELGARADALAERWVSDAPTESPIVAATRDGGLDAASRARLGAGPAQDHDEVRLTSRTDDEDDPESLLCRMRAEIGARRLPYRVHASPRLSALAATGDGVVLVATSRHLDRREVARTVLHELEGHAAPRARALTRQLGLFRAGTACGTDDQEGRALLLEERAGYLDTRRRRELALRHLACRDVEEGADFVATVRRLEERDVNLGEALRIAARAHRGGGLARELVYLPSYLRVTTALAEEPELDEVLAVGRVAVAAAWLVKPYLAEAGSTGGRATSGLSC